MGTITKTKTWADNEGVNYTDINANFDTLYNEVNGNLDADNLDTTVVATITGTQTLTNKTLTSPTITTPSKTTFSTLYAPQGFLINGKIVPSVASNNLTVAIKGLDGNDPSATNPVYCRIGDTVRTISAALSVTKNAGTNYFNSGGSELATKEIDYFVYLGYNATDGVVVGFARIPYATRYDGFSTTATAETYCAISTITTAAAGDYYEVIGRFAATLSAGAGYTWTVPTFTATNLIQRPIYETRWLSWLPTYTASGSLTYTSVSETADYQVVGRNCSVNIVATGTTGGTASTTIIATLPLSAASTAAHLNANLFDGSYEASVLTNINPVTAVNVVKAANWALAASKSIYVRGSYRMA